jgi:hypothetical protein
LARPLLRLGTHLIAIGAGLAGGALVSRWMTGAAGAAP